MKQPQIPTLPSVGWWRKGNKLVLISDGREVISVDVATDSSSGFDAGEVADRFAACLLACSGVPDGQLMHGVLSDSLHRLKLANSATLDLMAELDDCREALAAPGAASVRSGVTTR